MNKPDELDDKEESSIRFVSFNVNGARTFFHYQPFSTMRESLSRVFEYFDTDIITFQELKTDRLQLSKLGKIDGYYSFVTLPSMKKGYSGVGCWVKQYPEGHPLHYTLKVIKAEEGITGYLTLKINRELVRYRDDPNLGIGGYEDLEIKDEAEAMELDSQGRCVMLELGCGMIVISTYCPANSSMTDEGQLFRMKFLRILFKRIRNLVGLGRKLVLMGDLNICRDIMDSAEALEKANIKISNNIKGSYIDMTSTNTVTSFVFDPEYPHRKLLNQLLVDSSFPELRKDGVMIDSTRYIQTRDRLKMYTVWNTLKNTRPSNFGSRVDFILCSENMQKDIKNSNIMPSVLGSDHCPIFTDISVESSDIHSIRIPEYKIPRFEARYRYELQNRNVLDMFSKVPGKSSAIVNPDNDSSMKGNRITRKRSGIDNFFKKQPTSGRGSKSQQLHEMHQLHALQKVFLNSDKHESNIKPHNRLVDLKNIFGKPPVCAHQEEAILKTSKTRNNPGKKFWVCRRPKGDSHDKESSCNFFQWV